ncbi:MAG TPA: GNAT family N-acetyltransferase [Acidimicrobiales bacterium]|nr:GNAT family N-acetyltransferase [Acidimicrobiales bacterium]
MAPSQPGTVVVEELSAVPGDVAEALRALLPQLSSSASLPSDEDLADVASSPSTTLLVARQNAGGPVIGALTLAVFRIPTGLRAWIEDVVVDEGARGLGVGSALVEAAAEVARRKGCRTVDLTSRPLRQEANRLYLRLGFTTRQTNVYRKDLG